MRERADAPCERGSARGSWVFGLILIGLGLYFLAREYLPAISFNRLWPLRLVLLGVILVFGAIRRGPAGGVRPRVDGARGCTPRIEEVPPEEGERCRAE